VPNPDGSRGDASRDFVAQGIANVGGALTQALPTGGSLSRTGVAVSAGSKTRMAGVFAGIAMALIVLLLGKQVSQIPMAVIGGLMMIVGLEIMIGRKDDVLLVWHTSILPTTAMVLTFLATTFLPLQQAILVGILLSLVLFGIRATRASRLVTLSETEDGHFRVGEAPAEMPDDGVLILHYRGAGLFAEVPQMDEQFPELADSVAPYVVFSVRGLPDVSSSTLLKRLRVRAVQLREVGGCFILAEASPRFIEALQDTGVATEIGEENIFPETPIILESLQQAVDVAQARRAEQMSSGSATD
jgi:SulP family sulfate permease